LQESELLQKKYPRSTIEVKDDIVDEGWLGAKEGMLQIPYERKMIDRDKLNLYSMGGKKNQKDANGEMKPEFEEYVVKKLMMKLEDFKAEKNTMEVLCDDLSKLGEQSISILTSPKYHCEITGEGIELAWGLAKKTYRNIPLSDKKGNEKFELSVKRSITNVKKEHIRLFSGKNRRYMMAYMHINIDNINHVSIKKIVKKKLHIATPVTLMLDASM